MTEICVLVKTIKHARQGHLALPFYFGLSRGFHFLLFTSERPKNI